MHQTQNLSRTWLPHCCTAVHIPTWTQLHTPRLIWNLWYLWKVDPYDYKRFVTKEKEYLMMNRLKRNKKQFLFYSEALFDTDLTFQQSLRLFRPGATTEQTKSYFSGKHHFFGLRIECWVSPIKLAIGPNVTYLRATAVFSIFRANNKWH